jgi:hypothetical protein
MARNAKEEMAWKPRRLRKLDVLARVAHLQRNLPTMVQEVFAASEARTSTEPDPLTAETRPSPGSHQSQYAALLWEPRWEGRKT